MSRFKTVAIDTSNVGSWVERRRKGRMIRKQHTVTGAWSGWLIDAETIRHNAREHAEATSLPIEAENTGRATATTLNRLLVSELRTLANDRGIKVPSKWRKADIIIALTEPR
jgi:hypothetical protein